MYIFVEHYTYLYIICKCMFIYTYIYILFVNAYLYIFIISGKVQLPNISYVVYFKCLFIALELYVNAYFLV